MTDIKTKCREQEHVQMQPVPSYPKPKDVWTSSHLNHMPNEQPMTSFIKYQNLDQKFWCPSLPHIHHYFPKVCGSF